jgi:2-polyprenyl-3-methyl-5-hydroxy-6-metoxy-1,4-benzoquinol methylase
MASLWEKVDIEAVDCAGVVYKPFSGRFEVEKGRAAVNYFMVGKKGKKQP